MSLWIANYCGIMKDCWLAKCRWIAKSRGFGKDCWITESRRMSNVPIASDLLITNNITIAS
jgi:hypothetical protein